MAELRAPGAEHHLLHELSPRELTGRDVIARFQAQFRATALACLRILEDKTLDRVYCDFQDDFVERELLDGVKRYHFVQVKTKKSKKYQWSRLELFGIKQNAPKLPKGFYGPGGPAPTMAKADELKRIRGSFIGNLLDHTVRFQDSCAAVTFLTNAYFSDEVEAIGHALSSGDISERTVRFLADNYAATFGILDPLPAYKIHECLRKLKISSGHDHLDPHHSDFETKAIKAVWKYSEIDLSYVEGSELVEKLLALVEKKASKKLVSDLSAADIDLLAGISVDDLLDLLPISRGAYQNFLKNGDAKALKSASVLQRKLSQAGASSDIIEAASRWRVDWDNWFRTNRHSYNHEVTFLQHQLNCIYGRWSSGLVSFVGLRDEVGNLMKELDSGLIKPLLTAELLLGGIMGELVRSESR